MTDQAATGKRQNRLLHPSKRELSYLNLYTGNLKPLRDPEVASVYRIRICQRVGRSREQWREMIPPDVRDTPSTETKERCAAGLVSPSDETKTKAEQLGVQNRSVGQHLPKCRVFHHSLRICQGW